MPFMRKRVQITLAVLLIAVAAFIAWQILSPREPIYQGKRLGSWFQEYGHDFSGYDVDLAMSHMGTHAVPFLLRQLQTKDDSPFTLKMIELARRQRWVKFDFTPAEQRRYNAARAIRFIEPPAGLLRPAIPELLKEECSTKQASCAVRDRPEFITDLLSAHNSANPAVRLNIMRELACIATWPDWTNYSAKLEPVFRAHLNDPNGMIRVGAAAGLWLTGDPGTAIPVLTQAIVDQDFVVRKEIAGVFRELGSEPRQNASVAYFGLATPMTPHAIRPPALPTGWPPSSTLA